MGPTHAEKSAKRLKILSGGKKMQETWPQIFKKQLLIMLSKRPAQFMSPREDIYHHP